MREIYLSGFNTFVLPFMFGMVFVLAWCPIGSGQDNIPADSG